MNANPGGPGLSASADRADAPRLLLISYHFLSERRVGALRWRRMIPLLARAGWGVDVVTVAPGPGQRDAADLDALPPDVAVVRVADRTPLAGRIEHAAWRALRALRSVRSGASAGDAGARPAGDGGASSPGRPAVPASALRWRPASPRDWLRAYWVRLERRRQHLWSRAAAGAAVELARSRRYRAIVVSTPPHGTQTAGRLAARATGLPLVADLRDPWAATSFLPEHLASPEWLRLARAGETATMRAADAILANTEPAADALRAAHPAEAGKVRVVRNGWDDAAPSAGVRTRFVVAYAGSIYGDRSPDPLFRGVARMRESRDLSPERFGVELMGSIDGGEDWVRRLAEERGISDLLALHPPVARRGAEEFMARAAVLVSLPWGQDLSVPAKVYDYLRFETWPLILAAPGSAPERLLRGTGAAVVDPADVEGIAAVLCDRCDRWRDGERPGPVAGRERFTRSAAVADLLDALQTIALRADTR